jgi:D-alanyl-D-alanine carboxypeptidase
LVYGHGWLMMRAVIQRRARRERMSRPAKLLSFIALPLLVAGAIVGLARTEVPLFTPEAVDLIVRQEMREQNIAGVAVAVLHDGVVVHQAGFGMADLEHQIPVDAQTVFSIGSVSKQFIASAIMLLHQEGKVDLDANVANYISDAPAGWSKITVRHLLSHTSGLLREAPGFDPAQEQRDLVTIQTAYFAPLLFEAGERFEYSNVGYFILAEIIARVTGMSWPEFLEVRFFRPLGMTATRTTSVTDLIPHRSGSYQWEDGHFSNVVPFLALRPSGAFVSTVTDMAKWEKELITPTVLTQASLDLMWRRAPLNSGKAAPYGFGWALAEVNGTPEIAHGGALPGFRSYYGRYPEKHLSLVVLTNTSGADPKKIAHAIARSVRFPDPRGERARK